MAAAREPDFIEVVGAREHNLDISALEVPKRKLVVFTGPSGSGKSSLAFDTLYAEGQRRYVETLSAYARQFLGQLERPHVEHLRGLSPTIAIEQKSASSNPRSTVGTITEIYDYLRVLYARAGEQHCHVCGERVSAQSPEQVVNELLALKEGSKLTVVAPLVTHRKGEFRELFDDLKARGFARVLVDGKLHRVDEVPKLDKKLKHTIELVVDRVTVRAEDRGRIAESVELALKEGKGEMRVDRESGKSLAFSELRMHCGVSFPALSPRASRSTARSGCARPAMGSGRGSRWIRCWWCRIRRSRCATGPSRRGPRAWRAAKGGRSASPTRWPRPARSTSTRPGTSSRRRSRRWCSTGSTARRSPCPGARPGARATAPSG
ncbi:Excinuclease ABC subunit A [Minicystis rosea]|nr:Excinuclease ABC subunit A [Minicystis rosea]